ncbi:type I 3-dehydroquinate dehydratase [Methanobacterium aggregans]|uniref:type I 3-dehydroquinate dehydratase n=1 Tax=Methanobacterium aggregans TaxID=1615586 RepID=UPI001FD87F4E|nr:type I 3-dehydroquinate dehydratase [Methanobacterium aggregans]MBP2046606.1 3-dehydroquinate dehydratase-1 [Methanobacterium aggregans]
MTQKPMVCVPIFQKNEKSIFKAVENAVNSGADVLELRIDAMEDPFSVDVKGIIKDIKHPVIATNRMKAEGGFFKGTEEERVKILVECAKYAEFVDIELQTAEEDLSKIIKASKSTIISYHDFKRTPSCSELLKVVRRELEIGDIAKFAVMPTSINDTLIVLEVLSQVKNTIGISMGNIGRYTRVVAPLFGSPITFASLDKESAPGQLDIKNTKNILNEIGDWR